MKLLTAVALFVLIVFFALQASAQEVFCAGSRFQSLAGASVALPGCWSVFGNQAGLAEVRRPEVGGGFQNRFLVDELSTRSGMAVLPVQSSVFAVSFCQFGRIPFRQEKMAFSYARHITPQLNFGIQFNYYRFYLSEENSSAGSAGLELGMQYHSSTKLVWGLHILNPYKTEIKLLSGTYRYPSLINIGTYYRLSDLFSLTTELENDFTSHLRVKTGGEFNVLEKLTLRAGVSGKPYQLSAGFGLRLSNLTVDLATSYNQYLGNSPSVSFQYQF